MMVEKIPSNLHAEVITHNFMVHTVKSLRLFYLFIVGWQYSAESRKREREREKIGKVEERKKENRERNENILMLEKHR